MNGEDREEKNETGDERDGKTPLDSQTDRLIDGHMIDIERTKR